MNVRSMIAAHPDVGENLNPALVHAIEQALACAQACTSCADACLAEPMVADLVQCIRLDLDCADLCFAVARLGTRRAGGNEPVLVAALNACALACERCGDECAGHADHHDHCRICADACRACGDACRAAAASIDA